MGYYKTTRQTLNGYGFTDTELDRITSRGFSEEAMLAEISGWIDDNYSRPESVRDDFYELHADLAEDGSTADGEDDIDLFDSLGFYSLTELTEENCRPPEFIIDNMIPVGMTFLSGAPKLKKSFLALQMAIAVANGEAFFGNATHQCDVAYFDLEGSRNRSFARTRNITTKLPSNLLITNETSKKLSGDLIYSIRKMHQRRPSFRFFIIDTYSRARGEVKSGSANAYDADVAFLEPIQRMALEEGIAIMFVHHDKKGAGLMADSFERLSGTMAISGSSDCVINLIAEGKRFDGKATLEYTPRDAKGGVMNLEFNEQYLEWMFVPEVKVDLMGNPVCAWLVNHCPEAHLEGVTFSYKTVFSGAYNIPAPNNAGDEIRRQIITNREQLFTEYNIGIQCGVKSHGERGIRIINLND